MMFPMSSFTCASEGFHSGLAICTEVTTFTIQVLIQGALILIGGGTSVVVTGLIISPLQEVKFSGAAYV